MIAFHDAELPVAVATCGTALGEDHLDLLRRFTGRVVLAFDADEAGAGAALRGFERSVPGDLDLRVARFPKGGTRPTCADGDVEPAQAQSGSPRRCCSSGSRPSSAVRSREAEARGRAIGATAALVALHPDPVVRHEYAVLLSRRTGVDLAVVEQAIAQAGRRVQREREADVEPADEFVRKLTGEEKAELELLRLVLANDPGIRRSS